MDHDQLAVYPVHVQLDGVHAQLYCTAEGAQRVFGFEPCGATMSDDQERKVERHDDYGDTLRAGHLQYPGSLDLAISYQVLARRLRPARFEELVGQDHVVRALVHGLESGRVHHAYLFTGTRGVGKTTIARILAKCLNCEVGVSATPCGKCTSCLEIAEGRHVDLIEVDAASRTKVDDTRDLLDNVPYLPTRGRYKVYLIDEVHMLSASSFNALLKTLEEPPEHVKFLLATTDPKKVPLTVLSRCLQLQLKNLLPDKIADYLRDVLTADDIAFDSTALAEIARAGRGSMRDALSITDQAIAYGGAARFMVYFAIGTEHDLIGPGKVFLHSKTGTKNGKRNE